MSTIVVFGATGYAGGAVLREAHSRGHHVVGASRNGGSLVGGERIRVERGSIFDTDFADALVTEADAAIIALHAAGHDGSRLVDAVPALLRVAERADTRVGFVGGAGSLLVAPDGPRLVDVVAPPDAFKEEVEQQAELLERLRLDVGSADWFYVSPAARFGSYNPGTRTGVFRIGDDVLLQDDDGDSNISAEDFAIAIVDELEVPTHHRTRFSVAY